VAKVGTSKAGGTISQQAAVHPWLAADVHGNKQTYGVTLRRVRAIIVAVEKAISITYSAFVFVVLGIRHVMRMCHIVICGLPGSTVFFYITSQYGTIFERKKVTERNVFSLQICAKYFSF
jgi:hypothetical protein